MTQQLVKSEPRRSVLESVATRYGMVADNFEKTLRGTVFPPTGTREEFAAFLVVANEYGLNPITRQIYAFPKKGGGIVPVVGIDGWIALVNNRKEFNGVEFEFENDDKGNPISCTCKMYRKDRDKPVVVTEYLEECIRQTEPWRMKRRMLRHKTFIQGARYAFGFSGIHDEDEARDIADSIEAPVPMPPPPPPPATKPAEIAKPAEKVEDAQIIDSADDPGTEEDAEAAFNAEAWLRDDVSGVFECCKTEKNVDEAHDMFSDTVDTMLGLEDRQRYQELHEAALTRVTDAARAEQPRPQEPAPPAAAEKPAPAAASSLDDDEDETKVIDKCALYVARGDAVITDPKRTRSSIEAFWLDTREERLAIKKLGEEQSKAIVALQGRIKDADIELQRAEEADDDEAPEPAAPPAGDDPIAKFDQEYRAKIASIQSVTELHQYVESTLPTRNALGVDQAQVTKWREVKIARQNQLNGIA